MKKIWENPFYRSVIVLTAICLIVSALLAVTNDVTAPTIAENQEAAIQAAMQEVMPSKAGFTELSGKGVPETVQSLYRENSGKGYVVSLAARSQYSKGDLLLTVGIDPAGSVCGVTVTNYQETKQVGDDYPQKYLGATEQTVSGVDTVAGVTYSSVAFKNAVSDALEAVRIVQQGGAN